MTESEYIALSKQIEEDAAKYVEEFKSEYKKIIRLAYCYGAEQLLHKLIIEKRI